MDKQELIEALQRLLRTESDLSFLLQLNKEELETLVACVRDRVDNKK